MTFSSFFFLLLQDLKGQLFKVANFLGKSVTEEQLNKLAEHLRVDNFAKNDAVNFEDWRDTGFMNPGLKFVRKGNIFVVTI